MGFSQNESQLELFDVQGNAAPKPRAEYPGRLFFQLRYDQMVLGAVGAVIGLTVIFAFGVERGKQLVRSERMMLARQEFAAAPAPSAKATEPAPAAPAPAAPASKPAVKPAATPKPAASPAAAPKPKIKSAAAEKPAAKPAATGGRYAVQVATFAQATAARKELDRLHAKGKRAFMVMRNGRTAVYVGPMPKTTASEALSELKSQYRDCFVKAL